MKKLILPPTMFSVLRHAFLEGSGAGSPGKRCKLTLRYMIFCAY